MNPKIKNNIAILVILIIISGLFFIGKSGFSILSGLRAYVGGEGLWAKSQKEATYQLVQYVFTGELDRYQSFVDNLKVPLGDKAARRELEKRAPDDEIVVQGFHDGGIHPTDIPTIIFLYKYFKNTNYIKKAIEQWEVGDRLIEELLLIGEQVNRKIVNNSMSKEQTFQSLAAIDDLQKKLNEAENLFSYNMSAAARQTANRLFVIMLIFTLVGSLLCFILLRLIAGIISDLNTKKTQLENQAEREKYLKKELQESEEKYRLLVDNANDAILIIQDKRIKFFNPAALKLTGYTAGEFMEMPFKRFIHPRDKSTVVARYEKRVKGEDVLSTYNCRFLKKQGKTVWVQISAVRTMWEERGAALTFCRDITKLRAAESRIQQTERMESIGTLAGGIAHDFNNILSAIIGYTELSLDGVTKGTPLENNLQGVYKAGKRARDLVKQILAFARQSDEERKPIQVEIIAKEVLKLIRSTIPTTIEIKDNIESHSVIMGNSSQIHQLFMNLCTNAAQAVEDAGGVLEVVLIDVELNNQSRLPLPDLKPDNYLKITVSDTGPGISPDIIGSIFEPYFTTKGVGKGTGMGLALTHGIVESYGGKITVDSELGKGTVFSIYLPATTKHEDRLPYEKEKLPSGIESILFVDDELPIANIGCQLLEQLGYHVTVRTSSVEALELFRSKPNEFDLVITDMTMPNMTGDQLAAELMKIRPDILVILCSGYSKNISDEIAKEIGIKAFAYKPIVKADLAKTVRNVLDEAKVSALE
jgi:PAS domain S-box-containing protein